MTTTLLYICSLNKKSTRRRICIHFVRVVFKPRWQTIVSKRHFMGEISSKKTDCPVTNLDFTIDIHLHNGSVCTFKRRDYLKLIIHTYIFPPSPSSYVVYIRVTENNRTDTL